MKRVLIALSIVLCAVSIVADTATHAAPRRRRPAGMSRPSGGIVEKAYVGNVLRVLDAQKAIPAATVSACVQQMRLAALLPFERVEGTVPANTCPMATADALVAEQGVGAGVVIVEDSKLPWMVVAPESRWTILNVARLASDKPTPEKLTERFTKVFWCAIARTLGAGYSSYPGCVLVPFSTLKELDAIPVTRPCPEPFNKMIDTAKAYGINTITIASYRTACQKGWAPAPTNDVQKAIWEEIKADRERGPTNPLTLTPKTQQK